jgi:hypothetical protein
MKLSIRLATLLVLPACASAPTPAAGPVASPATTLGYALPAPPTASYSVADSTVFDIQGGAIGDIHVSGSVKATTAVTYAQNPAGLEATMRITDFTGSVANSAMGGAGPSATEADIEGPAVVTVSPRGAATVSAMPKLTPVIQTIGLSQSFFRRFFVRLPASSVKTGAVWVDTISTTDDNGGTKAVLSDIVTSTFARDTVINGNTIAIITSSSQRTLSISGLSQGVEIAQKLTGTGTGRVLWDTERHLLVERLESSQLTGTFDLPQMGVTGLPVTARGSLRIALE